MLVTAAASVSLHDTEKPELRITWGNLVFYTGGKRMKEWNDAGDHKETAEERKTKMEREKIQKKKILQGVLQLYIVVSYLKRFRFENSTLTVEQTVLQ